MSSSTGRLGSRSAQSNRREQPGGPRPVFLLVLLLVLVVPVAVVYAGVWGGHRIEGLDGAPTDPWTVFFGVLRGTVAWPTASSVVAALVVLAVIALAVLIFRFRRQRQRRGSRVDWTAEYMGSGDEVHGISAKAVSETANRLGIEHESPGIPIGRSVARPRRTLYGDFESTHVDIWGTRQGKTTSRAIPAIVDAPGAVLVTSNKRDVVDATRDVRALAAGPVWIFDPQAIANEPDTWWWDPLSYIRGGLATDTAEVKAETLADLFAKSRRTADAKTDAFFDGEGKDLLTALLLAAALDELPITEVYRWVTRPDNDTAVDILRRHNFHAIADGLDDTVNAPERQRGGVYSTAKAMATCLRSRAVLRWVTDDHRTGKRPQFHPEEFVRSGGTLYSLSKEGHGSAGGLVAALTVAVIEAAEDLAKTHPGGRLRVPLVAVLDEAANVCRWPDLPDLYSHYGSRGIILMTILQSWAQGVEVWGQHGMDKLWSAANVAVYGGGAKDKRFLDDLAELIGPYDKLSQSVSSRAGGGWAGVQTSQQLQGERIFDIADLGALPKGRAIVLSSGNRPTLVETLPWMRSPHQEAIRASIQAHDPQAKETLTTAENELHQVETDLKNYAVKEVGR